MSPDFTLLLKFWWFLTTSIKLRKKKPLDTLGSVYSTSASGAEQTTEANNSHRT